jgi:hypothetical protein
MKGPDLIGALLPRLAKEALAKGVPPPRVTLRQAAQRLGLSLVTLTLWKRPKRNLNENSVANLIIKARKAARIEGAEHALGDIIKPIVEFLPIEPAKAEHGTNYALFSVLGEGTERHRFFDPLRKLLEGKQGVYVFFDSRGRALYVGKTLKQNLWFEMNSSLNRAREVQRVWRVSHPVDSRAFDPSRAAKRQIVGNAVKLHVLARYVSAYEIAPNLIGPVESMLIRCFPNDILNVRMEKFGGGKQASRVKPKTRV